MIQYILQWSHLYIVHFGFWMTFAFGASIHKDGLPELKKLPSMLKTAFIIAAILSLFSSHSHHYMNNVVSETKMTHEIDVVNSTASHRLCE